jgi:predicted GIY-YIG superfamily endonuclease
MKIGYVYILECSDGTYYTGSTTDLERRLKQHEAGEGSKYTKQRLPIELIFSEEFDKIDAAFYREKQIQAWSRKKKQALIEGRLNDLPGLSKKVFHGRGSDTSIHSAEAEHSVT